MHPLVCKQDIGKSRYTPKEVILLDRDAPLTDIARGCLLRLTSAPNLSSLVTPNISFQTLTPIHQPLPNNHLSCLNISHWMPCLNPSQSWFVVDESKLESPSSTDELKPSTIPSHPPPSSDSSVPPSLIERESVQIEREQTPTPAHTPTICIAYSFVSTSEGATISNSLQFRHRFNEQKLREQQPCQQIHHQVDSERNCNGPSTTKKGWNSTI